MVARRILHLVTAYDPCWNPHERVLWGGRAGIDTPADCPALACRAAMALAPGFDHHVLIIGGTRVERRLARIGVTARDRLCPPRFSTWAGRRLLRNFLGAQRRFDIIQPWDRRLQPMIPTDAAADRCRVRPAPSTDQLAALLAASTAAKLPVSSHLREHASGEEKLPVVVFGADPPDAGDAASLFRVLGLTEKCGYRFAVVLPRGVRGVKRVSRLHRDLRATDPLIVSDHSALEWLGAADAVLTVAVKDDREPLIRSAAAARGVPVVVSPVGAQTMREYFAPAATRLREILDGDRGPRADDAADWRVAADLVNSWW
jgi:hypothetical protein